MDEQTKYDGQTASQLYEKGTELAKKERFLDAADTFEALEARYPFGEYADKAKLGEIYCHFMNNDNPQTLASAERFIKIQPRHPHVDYAYYMKGLAHYQEAFGLYARYMPFNRALRDVDSVEQSYRVFGELIDRYPASDYAPDAKKRMVYLRNVLAENEVVGARFYIKREAYLAAANRAQYVVVHFDQSPWVEEALYIQAYAYDKLNLDKLSSDAKRVLALNFPESHYLNELA